MFYRSELFTRWTAAHEQGREVTSWSTTTRTSCRPKCPERCVERSNCPLHGNDKIQRFHEKIFTRVKFHHGEVQSGHGMLYSPDTLPAGRRALVGKNSRHRWIFFQGLLDQTSNIGQLNGAGCFGSSLKAGTHFATLQGGRPYYLKIMWVPCSIIWQFSPGYVHSARYKALLRFTVHNEQQNEWAFKILHYAHAWTDMAQLTG